MSFTSDTASFQEKCWKTLYTDLFTAFFENWCYSGREITVEAVYSAYNNTLAQESEMDYNKAILMKKDFYKILKFDLKITRNNDGHSITTEKLGGLMIPALTPRGFIIGGNCYDVVNLLREAFGWYVTFDKKGSIIVSLKTKYGGKYIIFEDGGQLFVSHGKKRIKFAVMLKAITELDSDALIGEIGINNEMVTNTIIEQLNDTGVEKPVSECIIETLMFMQTFARSEADIRRESDTERRDTLTKLLNSIDLGREGFERYKKFVSFQRRAEGSVLMSDVTTADGTALTEQTTLGRSELLKLDSDANINSIVVANNDQIFTIKKFSLDNGEFNHNMMLNIASIAFSVFNGLGVADDRDSLENRVIENVASYIVECVEEYLNTRCREMDSMANRVSDIQDLANSLYSRSSRDYIIQKYKKETNIQLKDGVNIISDLAKSYKLSYKKNSSDARVGDAVRNIKVKQYMRVCPIDTPESKEVGLNTYMTMTAGVDENGFITATYIDLETGLPVKVNALDEMGIAIAMWDEDLSQEYIMSHIDGDFRMVHRSEVKYQDVGPLGLLSLSTGYVAYIANDKSKRGLMAANMNKQAVSILGSSRPLVVTGIDSLVSTGIFRARDIVAMWAAQDCVDLTDSDIESTRITITAIHSSDNSSSIREIDFSSNNAKLSRSYSVSLPYYTVIQSGNYNLFMISNEKSTFSGDDIVYMHRDMRHDDIDAFVDEDSFGKGIDVSKSRINESGFGIGTDLKVLFKCYKGFTYEDAVVLNRDLFDDKTLTSIYIMDVEAELHTDNTAGTVEEFGINDILLTADEKKYLGANGLPTPGSYIRGGQIIIGKIRKETDKFGNTQCNNASVRLRNTSEGWVVDARILPATKGRPNATAIVSIASLDDIGLGDKLVGRHGNKGVIAKIVPREDMPFAEDGTIPDIILSPLGPIARGNVGQLCECLVGMAGFKMRKRFVVPPASSEYNYELMELLKEQLKEDFNYTEQVVYDGETGLPYGKKMFIGVMHMYKLYHTSKSKLKMIGSSGNMVQESSQQPANGQRISELQVNAYIAHGATEVLDSLFSVQSDDIRGVASLQKRIRESGSSNGSSYGSGTENNEITGDNRSTDVVRAYLRTLGVDIETVDGGIRFKPLTDKDIYEITGNSEEKVVRYYNDKDAIVQLHNEEIFGLEKSRDSYKIKNRIARRINYGRLDLNYRVIMPILFRNPEFLNQFRFVKFSFEEAKHYSGDADDGVGGRFEELFLRIKVELSSISSDVVKKLITEGFTSLAYNPKYLFFFDTKDLDSLTEDSVRNEAIKFLEMIGIDIEQLKDRNFANKFHSPHKIDVLANMYYHYESDNLTSASEKLVEAYEEYEKYLSVQIDLSPDIRNHEFYYNGIDILRGYGKGVHLRGSDYFVTSMLIMPASFRPRYNSSNGERYNDIDATYIKIMKKANEVKNRMDRGTDIDFEVSRLYHALDSCYKKPKDSKSKISITDMLLTSNINKQSTVIRGHVGAKRVDHSARAVIVVNPELSLNECGIPYKIALTLWEDNLIYALDGQTIISGKTALNQDTIKILIRHLLDENYYAIGNDLFDSISDPIGVAKEAERCVINILIQIMENEIVALNREPTLHKFNTMSFKPVLCPGLSIQLHPLVCAAYNADFDGDTMAAYAIILETAKNEARRKMMTSNNIIDPKDGSNLLSLKQDIVLGVYMLTMLKDNSTDEIPVSERIPESFYTDISALEQDIDTGRISIYDCVAFRFIGKKKTKFAAQERYYVSTAGRIIFNSLLRQDDGFTTVQIPNTSLYELKYDMRVDSKKVNNIIVDAFNKYTTNSVTISLLDKVKEVGVKWADKSGITLSVYDFEDKSDMILDDVEAVNDVVDMYNRYETLKIFPTKDKKEAVIKLWDSKLKKMQSKIIDSMDRSTSAFQIIDSGSRGKTSDYNEICGIIGQVRNVDDTIIERPVLGNYLRGLSASDYFTSTYTARRGQISTSMKTADSGKNNREVSHMLANVRVVEEDCGAEAYTLKIKYGKIKKSAKDNLAGKTITNCKYKQFVGKQLVGIIPEGYDEDKYLTFDMLERTQLIDIELDGNESKISRDIDKVHRSLLEGRVVEREDNPDVPSNILDVIEHSSGDIAGTETVITNKYLDWIEDYPVESIKVRLLIGCNSKGGVCAKCHGKDIETKKLIERGKYIGLISGTAISEVATQATMDVHHATASATGMGNVAERFKNALSAKEYVKVSKKYDKNTGDYKYTVKFRNAITDTFDTKADNLTSDDAIREQGLAMCDGIVRVTDRIAADGKTIVMLSNDNITHEYRIDKRDIIVSDGEEVRKFQPLICQYDYNRIMEYDENFAKEFYIIDLADIFYSIGKTVRAIHFELIGREQTNYNMIVYGIDNQIITDTFPKHMSKEDVQNDIESRYPDRDVTIHSIKPVILGQNDIMGSRDFISDAFSGEMFRKVGKYALNGKVDNGTSPLTNLFVGRKVQGNDDKVFNNDVNGVSSKISKKISKVIIDDYDDIPELSAFDDLSEDTLYHDGDDDTVIDDGVVDDGSNDIGNDSVSFEDFLGIDRKDKDTPNTDDSGFEHLEFEEIVRK